MIRSGNQRLRPYGIWAVHVIGGLSEAANRLTIWLLVPLSVFFVSIIFLSVLTRFIFNHPIIESIELTRLSFVWASFLAAAVASKRRAHISISYFIGMLPNVVARAVALAVELMITAFGSAMAIVGWQLTDRVWVTEFPALGWSQGWLYLPLPVCGVVLTLHALARAAALLNAPGAEAKP